MQTFVPIVVQTCEDRVAGKPGRALLPRHGETLARFEIDDPFGIRKAVQPIFLARPDGALEGYGTAFSADGWGTFITADHIAADLRAAAQTSRPNIDARDMPGRLFEAPPDQGFVVLLGMGLIFGTVTIPQDALVRIAGTYTPGMECDDPIAQIQGRDAAKPFDIAILTALRPPNPKWIMSVPIRARPAHPKVGDTVVAVGYPGIEVLAGDERTLQTLAAEGMTAAYGRVTELFPAGRDRANPTPVFEVEADWPRGMSGGPVFNANGEVIGVVSRGLSPLEGETTGQAWATWLGAFSELPNWLPNLDPTNVDWRRGWAVVRHAPWHLLAVVNNRALAQEIAAAGGADFEVQSGSWPLGSTDFIPDSQPGA